VQFVDFKLLRDTNNIFVLIAMMMGMPMMMPPKLNSSPKQSPSSGGYGGPKQPTPPPMGQPKVSRTYYHIIIANFINLRECFFFANFWV
jgi:hypothetical protein